MGPETVLNGRYSLIERIGAGAMGEVWRARDLTIKRYVAIKILLEQNPGPDALERFSAEATFAGRVSHPGITVVYDIGCHDNQLYIVMELLQGRDLRAVLAEHPSGLAVRDGIGLALALQAAEALAAAHEAGVVHRDLKPANLFVLTRDRLKICDFGIAKAADATRTLTPNGHVIGTPAYMSPEQCTGKKVDQRSDLYSLGCVLYELFTGHPPFSKDQEFTTLAHQHEKVAPPPLPAELKIPKPLSDLVFKLLAKDPRDRPASADAVADVLRRVAAKVKRGARNRRWAFATGGTVAFGAVAIVLVLITTGIRPLSLSLSPHPPTSTPVPPSPTPPCYAPAKSDRLTSLVSWRNTLAPHDLECVGYSDSVPFVNPPGMDKGDPQQALQDARLQYDEKQVFSMDQQVEGTPGRTVLTVVYFAGLTSAPDDDYDSGEAEELEGLLAAQQVAYRETSGPMLRVVVANGGSKMQAAENVANMLVSLFRQSSGLVGVVGLDRSVESVKKAIATLGAHQIPMVATTLSANGIGGNSPYYFQLVPDNGQEATLILQYIRDGVTAFFRQPASSYYSGGQANPAHIWVYYPPGIEQDPQKDDYDWYIHTLVADLENERRHDPQFSQLPAVLPTTQDGFNLCGADTVVIYAGRHDLAPNSEYDTFATFLRNIDTDCPLGRTRPFIIADDGVSRFIADPAARFQPGMSEEWVSYVTKAIAVMRTSGNCLNTTLAQKAGYPDPLGDFCTAYAGIVTGLTDALREQGQSLPVLWTGDRVGLAYDAAWLFIQAAEDYPSESIPAAFQRRTYPGVTGTVDFTHSHIGSQQSLPLAIVRIEVSKPSAMPYCQFPGSPGSVLGPGPNIGQGDCP